uniref:Replication-associated protein n=1 Tax=Grus japonensis Circoviridae sp. TaxID=2815001 RepID=A0A8A4XAW6_9CIRC
MSKSRNWVFTINNPSDDDFLFPTNVKLLVANREIGASGTPHYQGYVEFNTSVALSHLRNWDARGHYEIRKGTKYDAIRYCLKDFLTDDNLPAWGFDLTLEALEGFGLKTYGIDKSLDLTGYLATLSTAKISKLTRLKQLIDEGASDKELADFDFDTWCRSFRALTQYRLINVQPRDWKMDVVVIYGPTGTGKSKYCNEEFENPYWKQRGKWWDNYAHQDTVVLDEFYGWLQWDVVLRLCDRYPLLVETKGGQVQFASKKVVFTSNTEPSLWYKNQVFAPFVRRVDTWIYMPRMDCKMVFTDYKDFLNAINSTVYISQI